MNHNKITFEEVILGILGIILIISGYYYSLRIVHYYDAIGVLMFILFATVIGAYLFLKVQYPWYLKLLKGLKGVISVNDVMFSSSIMYRIQKMHFHLLLWQLFQLLLYQYFVLLLSVEQLYQVKLSTRHLMMLRLKINRRRIS